MASSIFGGLLNVVGGLLGGTKPPKADAAPATKEVTDEADSTKKARVALTQTPGGIVGDELEEGQVKRRDNIFGN